MSQTRRERVFLSLKLNISPAFCRSVGVVYVAVLTPGSSNSSLKIAQRFLSLGFSCRYMLLIWSLYHATMDELRQKLCQFGKPASDQENFDRQICIWSWFKVVEENGSSRIVVRNQQVIRKFWLEQVCIYSWVLGHGRECELENCCFEECETFNSCISISLFYLLKFSFDVSYILLGELRNNTVTKGTIYMLL